MPKNRIREIRKRRGLTVTELADKVGISHTYVTRLENEKRRLSIPMAEQIAEALQAQVAEIIGLEEHASSRTNGASPYGGLADDAVPYVPGPESARSRPTRPNVYDYEIKTNALDRAGIIAGDVVEVDGSSAACESVKPLDCVIVQLMHPDPQVLQSVTLLRQFVPPSLLITNSTETNERMLDLDKDDVHLRGVITDVHRRMRR